MLRQIRVMCNIWTTVTICSKVSHISHKFAEIFSVLQPNICYSLNATVLGLHFCSAMATHALYLLCCPFFFLFSNAPLKLDTKKFRGRGKPTIKKKGGRGGHLKSIILEQGKELNQILTQNIFILKLLTKLFNVMM